jgi:hypothetical protein
LLRSSHRIFRLSSRLPLIHAQALRQLVHVFSFIVMDNIATVTFLMDAMEQPGVEMYWLMAGVAM